ASAGRSSIPSSSVRQTRVRSSSANPRRWTPAMFPEDRSPPPHSDQHAKVIMNDNAQPRALGRITVLDLTRVRAGPACVRQFGDWGANRIKVEARVTDPNDGAQADFHARHEDDFQNLHRH